MIKNKLLCALVFISGVCTQMASGMQDAPKSAPKSLSQYCTIERIDQLPSEMQQPIIREVVGKGGWWYPEAVLPHGCFVNSVSMHSNGWVVVTGAEDAQCRIWDLEKHIEIGGCQGKNKDEITRVNFSDGADLVIVSKGRVLVDRIDLKKGLIIPVHSASITMKSALKCSKSNKQIVIVS